jgi:hypothetical protein
VRPSSKRLRVAVYLPPRFGGPGSELLETGRLCARHLKDIVVRSRAPSLGTTYRFSARTEGIVAPLTLELDESRWELGAFRFANAQR